MGRSIGPKNKLSRRFGVNLNLKTNATKVARRLSQVPGQHGPNKRGKALSSFGKQLAEKQKAKIMFGMRERQFSNFVTKATGMQGDSGVNLQQLLEMRMDNVVYRMGFAVTRAQARQMVSHSMFFLNGKKMNIPSHNVKIGDVISVKENKTKKKLFEGMKERLMNYEMPSWLKLESNGLSGKVLHKPAQNDFEKVFDIKLIIESYSAR